MPRVALLFALLLAAQIACRCPEKCRCPETEEDVILEIHCRNVSLTDLPAGDLQETFFIDLSFNNISVLRDDEFLDRGFLKLARVYLDGNGMKTIEQHAFRGLADLQILNLAFNDLTRIPSEVFATNPELEALSFNGNNNLELPEIGFNLTNLDILSLSHCGLKRIPPKFFHNQPQVHYIFLRGNKLSTFDPELISPLALLRQLDLRDNDFTTLQLELFKVLPQTLMINFDGNPLSCDCDAFDTYGLYQSRRFYERLSCVKPTNISLREFFVSRCNRTLTPQVHSTSESATSSTVPETTPTTDEEGHKTTVTEPSMDDNATTTSDDDLPTSIPTTWNSWWIFVGVVAVVLLLSAIVLLVFKRRRLSRGYSVHRTFTMLDDDEEQNFIT